MRIAATISRILAWGIVLQVSVNTVAQPTSLEEVRQSVQSDLEQSLLTLATVREEIAAEKIPLISELNSTEGEIRELRREAARLQSVRDSRELSLIDLTASIQAWESENLYILNLLDEYANRFQSNLKISEIATHSEVTEAYRESSNAPSGLAAVDAQLSIVNAGMDRVRSAFGGSQYQGDIATQDGSLRGGTFTRFGPLVYFISDDRELGGIESAEEGLYARILNLGDELEPITQLTNGILVELPADVSEGVVAQISESRDNLYSQISRGGIWILPILFFAVLALSISIYKAAQILRITLPTTEQVRGVLNKLRQSEPEEAAKLAANLPAPVGPMLVAGVNNSTESPQLLEEILYENILETRPTLNRLLPVIATTAAVAPLLGLLGTVTGMINTFNLIAIFGTGDSRLLSSGISEALITTEFGLIVAIPALLIHALLSRRIKSILGDMEKFALIFTNGLSVPDGAGNHE
ncbi:MAG: MotA/TolQ/ExbB proton channel family protein [Pseudomonadales bacterium]|nr:MotA/TolQ/ExbB proton channel family protein [Pseudomonadales bacterium]